MAGGREGLARVSGTAIERLPAARSTLIAVSCVRKDRPRGVYGKDVFLPLRHLTCPVAGSGVSQ